MTLRTLMNQIEALRLQVEALEQRVKELEARKGPGRPPKNG